MHKSSSLRTPIKRARGLGAAHAGTHHFWLQRASAVALVPLTVWFVMAMVTQLLGADRAALGQWLHHPLHALATAAMLVALFTHARMGVQVMIEDYVHTESKKIVLVLLLNALVLGFGAASLLAVARLHFFGI